MTKEEAIIILKYQDRFPTKSDWIRVKEAINALIVGSSEKPNNHLEQIVCPKCGAIQTAKVEHTDPWYSYVHTCEKCGYTILESEWEHPNNYEGLEEAAENELANVRKELHEYNCGFLPIHITESFKHGAEWRDRMLNWARDLVQAGIDKPEEAVNILKRLKEMI